MSHTEPQPEKVQNLFNTIAKSYDTTNDAITFGMARLWRKKLVKLSGAKPGDKILDCATGTGDLAINFKQAVGPTGEVIGSDFSKEMLFYASPKAQKKGLDIVFEPGDATKLKYQDHQFNYTSIAYGIRNVGSINDAFKEMARVTKPGGKVLILETGTQENPIIKAILSFHFKKIVPLIGGFFSREKWAYEYLNNTSQNFPGGKNFTKIMKDTDLFSNISHKTLMFGASYIYIGTVK